MVRILYISFFFFNDTATTEIYTLSLHDALPISFAGRRGLRAVLQNRNDATGQNETIEVFTTQVRNGNLLYAIGVAPRDRKSTRLNSSHSQISYAVFCLKKKKKTRPQCY